MLYQTNIELLHQIYADLVFLNAHQMATIKKRLQLISDYLGKTKAIVISHDMGGKAAYVMAQLYPQSISKLILVDCLIPGTENADALHGGSWHYGFHMTLEIPEMLTKGREKEYIQAQIKTLSFKKIPSAKVLSMNMRNITQWKEV